MSLIGPVHEAKLAEWLMAGLHYVLPLPEPRSVSGSSGGDPPLH